VAYLYPPSAGGGAAGGQPGTIPTSAKWATALTGTLAVPTYADMPDGSGVLFSTAFGSAGNWRGAFRVDSGVSVCALVQFTSPTAGAGDTGSGVCLSRYGGTDNRILHWRLNTFGGGTAGLAIARFTDASTQVAYLAGSSYITGIVTGPVWLWLAEEAGNIKARASMDGVTWALCYSDTIANAYGTAGGTTTQGIGACGYGNADVQQLVVSRYQ
jgi:hypothetical protein